jgi:hypothetical protein
MKSLILILMAALCPAACQSANDFSSGFDTWSFSYTGGTLFTSPFQVTTKQLHFDTGELFGKDVILEGSVEYFGASFTHLLLADEEGKMLVVTTHLTDTYKEFDDIKSARIRVLGRLERGKKGLPYLMARAVDTMSATAR